MNLERSDRLCESEQGGYIYCGRLEAHERPALAPGTYTVSDWRRPVGRERQAERPPRSRRPRVGG